MGAVTSMSGVIEQGLYDVNFARRTLHNTDPKPSTLTLKLESSITAFWVLANLQVQLDRAVSSLGLTMRFIV